MSGVNTPEMMANEEAKRLRRSHSECWKAGQALKRSIQQAIDTQHIDDHAELGTTQMAAQADMVEEGMKALSKKRHEKQRDVRKFQYDRQVDREAFNPNLLNAFIILMALGVGEGCATAIMMATEGKMGIGQAFAYGWSFAGLNILLATSAGYLYLRYFNFRSRGDHSPAEVANFRRNARLGFGVSIALLAIQIFAAARTRMLGDHTGIFDFSEIGLWATFNDSMSLGIITIGIVGATIAVWEGYRGFSDPVPGYTDTVKQATSEIDADAEDLCASSEDSITETHDSCCDEITDRLSLLEDLISNREGQYESTEDLWLSHNNDVYSAIDRIKTETNTHNWINGLEKAALDLRPFEALVLNLSELEKIQDTATTLPTEGQYLSQLTSAFDEAITRIRLAHTAYQTTAKPLPYGPNPTDPPPTNPKVVLLTKGA